MTDPADFAARLVAAGLDAETAEAVAIELMPVDELRAFARSVFGAARTPATAADDTDEPELTRFVRQMFTTD